MFPIKQLFWKTSKDSRENVQAKAIIQISLGEIHLWRVQKRFYFQYRHPSLLSSNIHTVVSLLSSMENGHLNFNQSITFFLKNLTFFML